MMILVAPMRVLLVRVAGVGLGLPGATLMQGWCGRLLDGNAADNVHRPGEPGAACDGHSGMQINRPRELEDLGNKNPGSAMDGPRLEQHAGTLTDPSVKRTWRQRAEADGSCSATRQTRLEVRWG
jgi:hypothetical protein